MTKYKFLTVIVPDTGDLMALEHPKWGRQVWTTARIRKPRPCAVCGTRLQRRCLVYRPVTNKSNRMERICCSCIKWMIKAKEQV